MAANLSYRHAGSLLVVSASLFARSACGRCAPAPGDSHRAGRAAAELRDDRLRRAAAVAGGGGLCRPSRVVFQGSGFWFRPPPPAAGLLSAAAAAGFRRAVAADAG